jgi:hypothetical protein
VNRVGRDPTPARIEATWGSIRRRDLYERGWSRPHTAGVDFLQARDSAFISSLGTCGSRPTSILEALVGVDRDENCAWLVATGDDEVVGLAAIQPFQNLGQGADGLSHWQEFIKGYA